MAQTHSQSSSQDDPSLSVLRSKEKEEEEEEEERTPLLDRDDVSVKVSTNAPSVQRKGTSPAGLLSKVLNWNWRGILSFVILWFAYLSANATYSIIEPFFPNEASLKGSSSVVTGVIISCPALCVVFLSPLFGYFLPRLGVRFTILSGLWLVGGSNVLLGFASKMPSGWVFIMMCILLRLTEGVGSAMFDTAALAVPPQLFPKSVGTVTGLMEVATGIGFVIGPPLGGVLYAAGGFGVPFWVMGGLSLLFIPLCYLIVKVDSCKSAVIDLQALRKLSTELPFYVLLLSAGIIMAALSFPSPILQPYLYKEFGLDEEKVGLVFLVGPLVYLLLALFVGLITDRLNPRILIVLGFLIVGIGFFLFGPSKFISTPKLWLIIFGYAIVGVGVSLVTVPIFADALIIAQKHNPNKDVTGLVSGLLTSCYYTGAFVGPLAGGALYQTLGFQTSATIFGELLLAEGFLLLGIALIDRLHGRFC